MKTSMALSVALAATMVNGITNEALALNSASANILGNNPESLKPLVSRSGFVSDPMLKDQSVLLASRSTSGVSDFVGTMSVENFQGTLNNLNFTHESAAGFRNYLTKWYRPNFARQDKDVSVWLYHDSALGDNLDLWSSAGIDYGIDAVRTAWHSGHGGMVRPNVYIAAMGANWSNRGWYAYSNQMSLGGNYWWNGDERLRYMFWDTCNSVMISGGNSPYTTWGTRAKGVRMVFGYETTSIDSPYYGKYFWEEWNKGKSLSQAFLDASARISPKQSPAVVAFGATQAAVKSILFNERLMTSSASSNAWGQWRWTNVRSVALSPRTTVFANFENSNPQAFALVKGNNQPIEVSRIAEEFGIQIKQPQEIQNRSFSLKAVETKAGTLTVEPNGSFELQLKNALTSPGKSAMTDGILLNKAKQLARQLSFTQGFDLQASLVRNELEAGGSKNTKTGVKVVKKTVILDQVIHGVPFIDPNAGHLEISFDASSGKVNGVRSTLQNLQPVARAFVNARGSSRLSIDDARKTALGLFSNQGGALMRGGQNLQIAPNSESVGYQIIDNQAVPVFRAEIVDPAQKTARPREALVPLI
ncbi:MAG: DUF6345 domain-containing protein [Methyloglobulus sp.]|nr:hypothetical protein [Methyloglobulus sp.]